MGNFLDAGWQMMDLIGIGWVPVVVVPIVMLITVAKWFLGRG